MGQGGIDIGHNLFNGNAVYGFLECVDGCGDSGYLILRRTGLEAGRRIREEVQLYAVLTGDEAGELEAPAHALADHVLNDGHFFLLVLKGMTRCQDEVGRVNGNIDRNSHVGLVGVGNKADMRDGSERHAAEDNGSAHGEPAYGGAEIEHELRVVLEELAPSESDDAEKKESQGEEREESQGCFMFCEAHLSVL